MRKMPKEKINELAEKLEADITKKTKMEITLNLIELTKLTDSEISIVTELSLDEVTHLRELHSQFSNCNLTVPRNNKTY